LNHDPRQAIVYYWYANSLMSMDNPDESRHGAKIPKSVRIDPAFAPVWARRWAYDFGNLRRNKIRLSLSLAERPRD